MNKKVIASIGLLIFIFGITSQINLGRAENLKIYNDGYFCNIKGTIQLSDSVIRLGDPIVVYATIKNTTAETLSIDEVRLINAYGYDPDDYLEWVQEPKAGVLEPGKELEITWTRKTKLAGNLEYSLEVFHQDCHIGSISIYVINTFGLSVDSLKFISYGSLVIGLLTLLLFTPGLIKENSGIRVFLTNGAILIALLIAFAVGHFLSIMTGMFYYACSWAIFIWGFGYVVAFVIGIFYIKKFVPKLGQARAILIGLTVASILGFIAGAIMGVPAGC